MKGPYGHPDDSDSEPLERPSLVVGLLLIVAGLVISGSPAVAGRLPGNDVLVFTIGVVIVLVGVSVLNDRRQSPRELAETGDPEVRRPLPVPGEDLEADLQRVGQVRRASDSIRRRIGERLYEAAVAVVRQRDRVSRETAAKRVDAGEWTDDRVAAGFLAADSADVDAALSPSERVRSVLSLRSRFGVEARRAAMAILDLADRSVEETDDEDDPVAPGPATDGATRPFVRTTNRWAGVGGLGLVAGGVGVAASKPELLLVAAVPLTYAAYAVQGRPPAADLVAERSFELVDAFGADDRDGDGDVPSVDTALGEVVRVTVRVENVGDATVTDCRLVDGVPPGLDVVDGTPRLGTALRPGRTATFTYEVAARSGTHEFGPLQAVVRNHSGTKERELALDAPGRLTCIPEFEDAGRMPLHGTATRFTGRLPTDTGGEGVEFHSTREYRPGDPPSRIDWNRHARTRELATLLFREERAATVVLLVDTRTAAYRAPTAGAHHAVEHSVEAAGSIVESLLDAGDRVGLASFGPRDCWVPPGAGSSHRERLRRTLATDEAFDDAVPDGQFFPSGRLVDLRSRVPVDTQFVLLSPMLDNYIETVAQRLQAHGHPMTVISPDVTADDALGHRLVQVERHRRLNTLRESAVRVVDWDPAERLELALDRASRGWSV